VMARLKSGMLLLWWWNKKAPRNFAGRQAEIIYKFCLQAVWQAVVLKLLYVNLHLGGNVCAIAGSGKAESSLWLWATLC